MMIQNKIPTDVLEYIKVDAQQFMGIFYPKITWSNNDFQSLVFEAVTSPYDNYIIISPKQKVASDLTEPAMKVWGLTWYIKQSK